MDSVLRGLRTGVAVERHDEDADGGVRPDALRERLALLPLREENAREIDGEGYQRMIDASAAQRTGTSDEIAEAAAFLLDEHARFITGTDLLIDGGVIASIRTGMYKLG